MKRILIFSALFAAGLAAAQAAVPYRVSFQGRLDDGGSPATGTRAFVFKIYDALTGGTLLWTSQTESVAVTNGVFSVVLETGAPANLSTGTFSGARFVEISVDGTLLSPRETVVSAPYALVAQSLAPGATVYLSALEKDPSALSTVNTATNPVDWSQLKNVPGSVLAAGGALTVNEGGALALTPATTVDFNGPQFNISGAAATASVMLAPSSVTLQGNAFNGNSQLLLLDPAGKLPALDGSALTALNASNLASGTLADGRLSGTYSGALTFGSAAGGPITISTDLAAGGMVRVGGYASAPSFASPGAGSIYFNTGNSTLYVSNGAAWNPLASGGASPWTGGGTGTVSLVAPTDKVSMTSTAADALKVSGGITAGSGNVDIVDTTGKIPALSATYIATLSGASLTSLTAANISAGTLGASVVASSVPAANIGVGKLGTQVVASSLAVNSVYSGAIAAGAITATSIGAGTLGATVVASSVPAANVGVGFLGSQVVASSLAVNSVYSGAIAAGAITATNIGAGTLGATVVA
ncbi:MAG: hypothetical protein HY952_04185, partial [Elusimicrobia bacterium]|nr:hypothetical protein [Elusimicrobiota bacterium]